MNALTNARKVLELVRKEGQMTMGLYEQVQEAINHLDGETPKLTLHEAVATLLKPRAIKRADWQDAYLTISLAGGMYILNVKGESPVPYNLTEEDKQATWEVYEY